MEKLIRWMVKKFMKDHHLKRRPVQGAPRKKREPKLNRPERPEYTKNIEGGY